MTKIVNLCPICGGRGKFIMQKCPSCNGKGGAVLKFNKNIEKLVELNPERLNEQESKLFELCKSGFSQKEIAKKMDIAQSKVTLLFYQIEKKLNA